MTKLLKFDQDYNLLLFFLLIIGFFGSIWLAWKKIDAGYIYALMFVGIVSVIFLAFLFTKDDVKLKRITDYIKSPFSISLGVACLSYLFGWIAPILLKIVFMILNVFLGTALKASNFMIPLFSNDIVLGVTQSFSQAEISRSMMWKIFNVCFTAGIIEEFTFTFGTMVAGVLVGLLIVQLLNNGKDFKLISKKNFIIIFAFLFSLGLFTMAHQLNASYVGWMFVIAGVFKLVSLVSVYVLGMFLTFWVGYHQSNNLVWLIEQEGLVAVFQGFVSWFGLIFIVMFLLIFIYVSRNFKMIWAKMWKKKGDVGEAEL